jgi:hypothetical protein
VRNLVGGSRLRAKDAEAATSEGATSTGSASLAYRLILEP